MEAFQVAKFKASVLCGAHRSREGCSTTGDGQLLVIHSGKQTQQWKIHHLYIDVIPIGKGN